MKIECPSCSAAYDVPEARLAPGRTVKCARCATAWTPIPIEAAALPAAELPDPVPPDAASHEVEPEAVPEPQAEAVGPALEPAPEPAIPVRARSIPLIAAWVLSVVLLAALTWAAIDRRTAIMHAWPASTRAYAAIGLTAH